MNDIDNKTIKHYCYNCGKSTFSEIYTAPSFDNEEKYYRLGRCVSCGIVNTPGIKDDELSDAYSRDYYRSSKSKFTGLIEYVISYFTSLQARRIIKEWHRKSRTTDRPEILDIGCGRGKLLQELDLLGAITQGLERAEFPQDDTVSNVHIGELSDPVFNAREFDIVILWHVLEHMDRIEGLFSEVVEHMRPNSVLIIAVPNFDSFQQRIFGRHWFHLDLPRHLVHLESDWLASRLGAHGLAVERIRHFDLLQNYYGFIQSALNWIFPKSNNEFYRMLQFNTQRNNMKFIMYGFIAIMLTPFAIIESIYSCIVKKGSTITVTARLI